jgi:hypothetical protein
MKVPIADDEPGSRLLLAVGHLVKGAPDGEIARVIRSAARW